MRTYGKPQIKATSTWFSANSSKDCPTLKVVWQPTLSPTYLAICAYVSYKRGDRNDEKRIAAADYSYIIPFNPLTGRMLVFVKAILRSPSSRLTRSYLTLNLSNRPGMFYVSPQYSLPEQDATPSQVSIYLTQLFFPKLLPWHVHSVALLHSKYQCS